MKKRLISIALILVLILSVCSVCSISASAADDTAYIKVGGTTYSAKVGDFIEYRVDVTYSGSNLAYGQIELPVDFSGLSGYTQSELSTHINRIAPTTASTSVVERFDQPNTFGLVGFVMNFAGANGYSFSGGKRTLALIFGVEKAGTYELKSKLRYFDDVNGKTVVDSNYNIKDNRFSYKESIVMAQLDTPKLSVSTDAGGMKISWDPVPRAGLYRVYYKGRNGWTKMVDTHETSYLDTDVEPGVRYTYTVRCLAADASRFTSDFDRDGEAAVYYPAPILKLSNAEDGVKISWDATYGAKQYRVYYKGRNGWTKLEDTSSTSVLDNDVVSGTRYTYTIRAMDNNGNHLSWFYKDGFSITFISAPVFKLSNAANGVEISWNKVTGAAKYRVFYYGSRGWTRLTDTAETSFIDTDVRSNQTYTYTVRCITADGSAYTSDYRVGKSIKYYAAPILKLSNEADGVRINWDAIPGAAKYRVYYRGGSGWTKLVDTASTTALDTDVVSGTNYTYTIRAMDSNGNHLSWFYADGFRIQFIRAPELTLSNVTDGVQISWNKVTGAKKYRVFYYGSKGWTRLVDTTDTSFVDKDVSSNYNYTYTVRCITEDGSAYISDFRPGKSIKYYAAPKLTLSSTSTGVSMKWNAIPGASQYRLYYRENNTWNKLVDVTGTSHLDTLVRDGDTYTYTIRAMDANGNHLSWFYVEGFTITYHKS